MVEGRLKLDQWEDKNGGGKRKQLKVVVELFYFADDQREDSVSEPKRANGRAVGRHQRRR